MAGNLFVVNEGIVAGSEVNLIVGDEGNYVFNKCSICNKTMIK